jgi:outer membrane protein
MKRFASLAAIAAFLLTGAATLRAADDKPRRLTLAQAVDAAASDNPELAITARSVDIAQARVDSAKTLRLPSLSLDAIGQYWFGEQSVPLGPTPFVVRDDVTWSAGLTLAQPISGLAVVGKLIKTEEAGVDVAKSQLSGAKLDTATRAATTYLQTMQARAAVDVAEKSVAQLDAQVQRARTLESGGVLAKVDVMRFESARSHAAQEALAAHDRYAQALDGLALILGLKNGDGLDPVDDLSPSLPAPPWDEATATALAAQKRPELKTAQYQVAQAEGAVQVKRADYFPNVTALANYTHAEGNEFADKDAYYVGVSVKWTLWDWGTRGANMDEVRGRAGQARLTAERQRDYVNTDVRGKLRTANTSFKQLAVAQEGLATSEEAYRITTARFQNGAATTIDVLDAELDVARSRLEVVNNRYGYAIALVELAHAVGEQPLAALSASPAGPAGSTTKAAPSGESR